MAEGPVVDFYSFPYPTRMVVVRLQTGGLWVWSPIVLNDVLVEAVQALGPVAHIVAPNPIHHLFLREWQAHWPKAKIWGPISLQQKRKDILFDGTLSDVAPDVWADDFVQVHFTNSRFLDEVDFVHLTSRTAIFADLTENFSTDFIARHWSWWQRPIARVWKIIEGWGYAPLELRLTFRDRKTGQAKLERILAAEPEQVVMAHGEVVRENGAAYLRRAFSWLLN